MRRRIQSGFTAVELLVGMGIFVIVVGISVGVFIRALRLQRQTVALMAANDNASLVLEQMAREMRTGYNFGIPGGTSCAAGSLFCSGDASEITFVNAVSTTITYRLTGTSLERAAVPFNSSNPPAFLPITGSNVEVTRLRYYLVASTGAVQASRVTIVLGVRPSASDPLLQSITTNLQTTMSVRL